ncbi:hypothetical protein M5W83_07770 [Paenibacillus thiaminolyticus]|uniref:Uncharacterized protein n=1 Tax=Paenibacillus thiaminolyticus TaxID=49283 RepID=A0AAP9DY00_PANTH|nr:hypothetical protein [Paenibacillus thiaminolyticus]MCY9533862.1 hypothetical protein [Paenibacillus thiaminolyticus]MCY9601825.1 hypothetical protein [Paenibacillus thiaminolyticus]MCY9607043.1 hypothetical protein [Paenibacillus thiaminolyticus]MCY9614269.1 hypothetical protein [Paenibacillus thiaminolyticus]MCY9619174.1 hypothetical protein [Paenibacillus thiaminolyticus]
MDIFEKLLRILLNNPFLAVILIGFVFSLLRKGNKPPANRMPSFGGDKAGGRPGSEPDDHDDEPVMEEKRSYPVYTEERSQAGLSQGYASHETDTITLEERIAAMKPSVGPASAPRHAESSNKKSAAAASAVIRPEEALKGVLWSEILGPPRAKRPYGRRSS